MNESSTGKDQDSDLSQSHAQPHNDSDGVADAVLETEAASGGEPQLNLDLLESSLLIQQPVTALSAALSRDPYKRSPWRQPTPEDDSKEHEEFDLKAEAEALFQQAVYPPAGTLSGPRSDLESAGPSNEGLHRRLSRMFHLPTKRSSTLGAGLNITTRELEKDANEPDSHDSVSSTSFEVTVKLDDGGPNDQGDKVDIAIPKDQPEKSEAKSSTDSVGSAKRSSNDHEDVASHDSKLEIGTLEKKKHRTLAYKTSEEELALLRSRRDIINAKLERLAKMDNAQNPDGSATRKGNNNDQMSQKGSRDLFSTDENEPVPRQSSEAGFLVAHVDHSGAWPVPSTPGYLSTAYEPLREEHKPASSSVLTEAALGEESPEDASDDDLYASAVKKVRNFSMLIRNNSMAQYDRLSGEQAGQDTTRLESQEAGDSLSPRSSIFSLDSQLRSGTYGHVVPFLKAEQRKVSQGTSAIGHDKPGPKATPILQQLTKDAFDDPFVSHETDMPAGSSTENWMNNKAVLRMKTLDDADMDDSDSEGSLSDSFFHGKCNPGPQIDSLTPSNRMTHDTAHRQEEPPLSATETFYLEDDGKALSSDRKSIDHYLSTKDQARMMEHGQTVWSPSMVKSKGRRRIKWTRPILPNQHQEESAVGQSQRQYENDELAESSTPSRAPRQLRTSGSMDEMGSSSESFSPRALAQSKIYQEPKSAGSGLPVRVKKNLLTPAVEDPVVASFRSALQQYDPATRERLLERFLSVHPAMRKDIEVSMNGSLHDFLDTLFHRGPEDNIMTAQELLVRDFQMLLDVYRAWVVEEDGLFLHPEILRCILVDLIFDCYTDWYDDQIWAIPTPDSFGQMPPLEQCQFLVASSYSEHCHANMQVTDSYIGPTENLEVDYDRLRTASIANVQNTLEDQGLLLALDEGAGVSPAKSGSPLRSERKKTHRGTDHLEERLRAAMHKAKIDEYYIENKLYGLPLWVIGKMEETGVEIEFEDEESETAQSIEAGKTDAEEVGMKSMEHEESASLDTERVEAGMMDTENEDTRSPDIEGARSAMADANSANLIQAQQQEPIDSGREQRTAEATIEDLEESEETSLD